MSTPYFYIIKHIPSNKLYAGYKNKNANPSTFMLEDGYQTSSKSIHNLILSDGLSSFEIVDIILEDEILIPFGWSSIYQFETWFLQFHDCAHSSNWINIHNNQSPIGMPDYSGKLLSSRKKSVLIKYGVDNISKLDSIKHKKVDTLILNYGSYDNYILERNKKSSKTCVEKYGTHHPMQNDNIKQTHKDAIFSKFGVDNVSKLDNVKLKKQETCMSNYGVEYYSKTPEARQNLANRNKIMNSIEHVCPHCGKIGKGNNMFRYHFDKCKTKPL